MRPDVEGQIVQKARSLLSFNLVFGSTKGAGQKISGSEEEHNVKVGQRDRKLKGHVGRKSVKGG